MVDSFIEQILNSQVGKYIISIIWGLALASLFYITCINCDLVIYKNAHPKNIIGKTYNYGTKDCYQYQPYITKCAN